MRKVFLDCGAHCGCTRRKAQKIFSDYTIFSFEADPELCSYCPEIINKAVWIEDCRKTFYKFSIDGGSSLSKTRADLLKVNKPNYYDKEEMDVECFNLNNFIINNFSTKDEIILKLDVECAEYSIVPHLLKNGGMDYINQLLVEWHDVRCGCSVSENKRLTKLCVEKGIKVGSWDAMKGTDCIVNLDKSRQFRNKR